MIDIVKLTNGNVAVYDSTTGDFINSLSPDIVEIQCNVNGTVKIIQDNANVEYFDPATVANTQIQPAAPIPFAGDCAALAALLSSDFFFIVSGGGAGDLATVLAAGNIAGTDINMNGNDLLNVDTITSSGDLILNPVGSIDANGNTINMTGGEIHNVPLIHSQNNTDLVIEGKGTADVILKTNNANKLTITDNTGITYGTYADLNGQDIKNLNNASGKNNTDLTVEALGTGDIVFKTNNVDRLKITDTGTFIGLPDPAGWTYIVKSANQDVTNNATPQDDSELQFSVVAGGHYMLILDLVISANNTTSAYLGRFQISSGTMKGHGIATIPNASGSANIFSQNANAVAQTVGFISGPPVGDLDQLLSGTIIFSFTASANAIFKYQFSGQVSGAGRTSRTWKGSILKYKRID